MNAKKCDCCDADIMKKGGGKSIMNKDQLEQLKYDMKECYLYHMRTARLLDNLAEEKYGFMPEMTAKEKLDYYLGKEHGAVEAYQTVLFALGGGADSYATWIMSMAEAEEDEKQGKVTEYFEDLKRHIFGDDEDASDSKNA